MSSQTVPAQLGPIELAGRDLRPHRFTGQLLGSGTSRAEHHAHDESHAARPGEKCSACRWFEVAIYRRYVDVDVRGVPSADLLKVETALGKRDYVVHTVGGSAVPGEDRRSRVSFTPSAFEVIELLTVRPRDGEPYIAQQSALALAQAAALDGELRDAYINRAVV